MQLKYRYGGSTYSHSQDEIALGIRRRTNVTDGRAVSQLETWSISGRLISADQSALTTAIQALQTAYSNANGTSLSLYLDDGSTESAHVLTGDGGVIITECVGFPEGRLGQYSYFRDYVIEAVAERQLESASGSNPLVEWTESLSFTGTGGPDHVVIPTRNTAPVVQITSQATATRAIQSGRAVGRYGYLLAPPPLWPQWFKHKDSQKGISSPKVIGSGSTREKVDFETTWNYVYEAPFPLNGFPTDQPR